MAKFLNETGLAHLWSKVKAAFVWSNLSGVPAWITQQKPVYTASEVGALPDSTQIPAKVSDLTNDAGFQTQSQVASLIEAKVSSMLSYKGSVANYAALPNSGNKVGDTYNVSDTGKNYAWDGSAWDDLGGTFAVEAIANGEIDSICT